jgi:hypothetical protein
VRLAGLGWARLTVDWASVEPAPGARDWSRLDAAVAAAEDQGLQLLLTVTRAPAWARPGVPGDGPPADALDYAAFSGALARRYRGRVAAYEIWEEQNLARAWRGAALEPASYLVLLRAAYTAIKAADPAAQVITGGLAPTRVDDGVTAVDDRVYLEGLYQQGVALVSDGVGAHPGGWANQPESYCCNADPEVTIFDDHPSLFFRETLEAYHTIIVRYGDGDTLVWVTAFGWGSVEGLGVTPPPELAYVTENTAAEQGDFLLRAFAMGRAYGWVGPMFVWNLNACIVRGLGDPGCLFSLLGPDGSPRPAFETVAEMAKP